MSDYTQGDWTTCIVEDCGARSRTRYGRWCDYHLRCYQATGDALTPPSGPPRRKAPGGARTPTYVSWMTMRVRCRNPKADGYKYYGGRGIAVCERWDQSYQAFHEDMGDRPSGHSLDRLDGDGNYEPGNCRWATPKEQAANRRLRRDAKGKYAPVE